VKDKARLTSTPITSWIHSTTSVDQWLVTDRQTDTVP